MDRYKAADAEKAVAVEAVDQSVAAHRTAQAALAAAEASVESNRANVQRLDRADVVSAVVAPFSGTVIQRNVDVGALITAGSPVDNTAVAPIESHRARRTGSSRSPRSTTFVCSSMFHRSLRRTCAPGLPVQLTVRGQLDAPVTASVTRTASALDPGTRTLLTQVDIPNPSGRLLPGMFVYVDVQDRTLRHALARAGDGGHHRRAGHPRRDHRAGKHHPFSTRHARPRLRGIDRHPGRAARQRNDRRAADGVTPGGPGCQADRVQ